MSNENEVVLSVECNEPEGKVLRNVTLTKITVEKLKFLWEKMSRFDVLFNDFVRGDFEAFVSHFILQVDGEFRPAGLMWDVDDVGMFLLNELRPGDSALAHFVFWDERFRGREELCKQMLKYVFSRYGFRRIRLEIPLYATFTLKAADRIGFVLEGRFRKAIKYKGDWYDVNSYSILPEDLENPMEAKVNGKRYQSRISCVHCSEIFLKERVSK